MANQFKDGDLVQLKSGGPTMTVTNTSTEGKGIVYTKWFAGSKLESGNFPAEALQAPPPKEPKSK